MQHETAFAIASPQQQINLRIGEPFTVIETSDSDPPGWQRIHPNLRKLPGGRLVLTVSRDRDIPDAELLVFTSDDEGQSWRETTNWPTASERGQHVDTHLVTFPDGALLALNAVGLFPSGEQGGYVLPSWRSGDGGETWGAMFGAAVTLDERGGAAVNLYDRPQWYLDLFNGKPNLKAQMPPAVQRMADAFGTQRLGCNITDSHVFADGRVLLFAYLTKWAHATRGKHETVVFESTDRGRSWHHLATPGPWEDRLDSEFFLTHPTNGLCEPGVAALGDELLCVMRLGSRHPLYQTRSSDGGRTWSRPMAMPVYGILPTLCTMQDGLLALATGRPDVTLSLSSDGGYRWPITYRFLEDGKPEDPSTRNNTMIALSPTRLLYMYDYGGYHALSPAFTGPRRVVGHYIDLA